jgi:hypothetical protein
MTDSKKQREALVSMERAQRFIAAHNCGDDESACRAVREAQRDGSLFMFSLSAGILAARATAKCKGDRAQLDLDGLALDAAWFRDRELEILDQRERERNDDA